MRTRAWTVYLLRCRDCSLYTGATNDLARRLAAHRAGKGGAYTRSRLPVRVVYSERVRDRSAALRREAALKRLWSFMAVSETAEQKEQAAQFCLLFERWEDAELLAKDAIQLDPQVKQAPAILQAARMRKK